MTHNAVHLRFLKTPIRDFFGFLSLICPLACLSQATSLGCSDVKNGNFNYFPKGEGDQSVYIRNGTLQKEVTAARKETILWEVTWLNDCTYTLKYISRGEQWIKAEQDIFRKYVIVCQILSVTDDYYVYRTVLNKITNNTILTDTLWIKQRRSASNKLVINPPADSIVSSRLNRTDISQTKYAILYVYRPVKFLNS